MVWSQLGNATGNALDFGASSAPSWFSGFGDTIGKGFDWFGNNSKGLGAAGSLWGAYNQMNMGNKMYGLQKDAFDYNKMLSEEERKRRAQFDTNMTAGFANSTYGKA